MRHLQALIPAAFTLLFATTTQAAPTVSVYNWTDYIGDTTLADFQASSGIKV
ncbi:MAG: polyamine ABC transporter substrate-binding protein, partial [Pseudomonas alloputida]